MAAAYLSGRSKIPVLGFTLLLIFVLSLTGLGVVNKGWIIDKNASTKDDTRLGRNDPTLDMYGWDQFKLALESIESDEPALKSLPIVANKWYPGSHLYYYVAKPLEKELYVMGDMKDMHKYYWINQTKPTLEPGQEGIYFTLSRNFKDPEKHMSDYFNEMILLKEFPVKRGDKTVEYGYVYLLKGYKITNLEDNPKE